MLNKCLGTILDEDNNSLQGTLSIGKGDRGKSIEYIWRGTELGIRIEGQTEYNFVDLEGKATNIHLQKSTDYIQWKYVDEVEWKNLVPLLEIKGDKGETPSITHLEDAINKLILDSTNQVNTLITTSTDKINENIQTNTSRVNTLISTSNSTVNDLVIRSNDNINTMITTNTQKVDNMISTSTTNITDMINTNTKKVDTMITTNTDNVNYMINTNNAKVTDMVNSNNSKINNFIETKTAQINNMMDTGLGTINNHVTTSESKVNTFISQGTNSLNNAIAKFQQDASTNLQQSTDRITEVVNQANTNFSNQLATQTNTFEEVIATKTAEVDTLTAKVETAEALRQQQHLDRETFLNTFESRITGIETTNTTQDTRLNSIETLNNTQNTRLDKIDVLNTNQDKRLDNVEYQNKVQDVYINGLFNENADKRLTIEGAGNDLKLEGSAEGLATVNKIVGNTAVNYCTGGDRELYLNGDIDVTGTSVSITEGVEGGLIDVACEGDTLVNLIPSDIIKNYQPSNNDIIQNSTWTQIALWHKTPIKPNTTYTFIVNVKEKPNNVSLRFINNANYIGIDGTSVGDLIEGINIKTITTTSTEIVNDISHNYLGFLCSGFTEGQRVVISKEIMLLEGDYTNKPIPSEYFEGMKSVGQDNTNGHSIKLLSEAHTRTKGESKEGEFITYEGSTDNDLIEVTDIWGNTIQNEEDLSDIQHLGELYVDELGQPILDELGREQYKIEIESCNKNLFGDIVLESGGISADGYNVNDSLKCRSVNYLKVKPNTTYSLSKISANWFGIYEYDENKKFIKMGLNIGAIKGYLTTTPTTQYVRFRFNDTLDVVNNNQVQFEENTISTTFIPHQSNKTTILLPCQLMKVGDVADRLYWDSVKGKYVVEKNISVGKLTSEMYSKTWTDFSEEFISVDFKFFANYDNWTGNKNHLNTLGIKAISWFSFVSGEESCRTTTGKINFNFKSSRFNVVSEQGIKDYINSKNVYFYYELATPQLIETNITEQIKLPTYADKTHVFVTGGISGEVSVEYIIRIGDVTKSNFKQINLSEPLRGLPNGVKDRFVKRDGKWYVERNCAELNLWADDVLITPYPLSDTYPDVIGFYYTYLNIRQTGSDGYRCMCNILPNILCSFPGILNHNDEGIDVNGAYLKGAIKRSKVSSLDARGIKEYFKSVNAKVVYPLNTPIYEPLNITPELETYLNVTHISNNSSIPCNMQVKNTGYNAIIKPSTLYTVIADTSGTGTFGVNLGGTKVTTSTNKLTITTPATLTENMLRPYGKGLTASKFRLLEGETTLNYPYFEGLRSTFENEIVTQDMIDNGLEKAENLGKYKCNVKVRGKNIFDCVLESGTVMGGTLGDNPKSRRSKNYIECTPLKQYTLSKTGDSYGTVSIYDDHKTHVRGLLFVNEFSNKRTFKLNGKEKYIKFYSDSISEEWQLEEGAIATTYEPYYERTKTIYLNSPLLKGDELVIKEDGLYHYHKMGKVVLDGSDDEIIGLWYPPNNNDVGFTFNCNSKPSSLVSCDKIPSYLRGNIGTNFGVCTDGNVQGIRFILTKTQINIFSVSEFKQWLKANPTTVVYELAEPYYEKVANYPLTLECTTTSTLSVDSLIPCQTIKSTYTGNIPSVYVLEETSTQNSNYISDTQIAVDFLLMNSMPMMAMTINNSGLTKKGENTMGAYFASRIMRGYLSYAEVVAKYPQFKDDIDFILKSEGREDLITI